jgi:hypothetical protein
MPLARPLHNKVKNPNRISWEIAMNSQNDKEGSGHVRAAVIGGIFALLAAIIGGFFLIINTMVNNGIIVFGMSNPKAQPTAIVSQSQEPVIVSVTSTPATDVQGLEISTPDAPLYDDFENNTINSNKWGQPLWDNPYQKYTPIQSQGALHFELSTNSLNWFDWAVKQSQSIEEMYALVTLDSANDGAFGISLRMVQTGFSYNLMLKKNHVSIWNDPKELGDFQVSGTCCPYTHLLGAITDGSQIHFYVDNKLIGSYPFDGYPDYGTLQIVGATRTVASASDVWIKCRP